jgi:Domain of unknown function (DUF1877)
MSMNCRFLQISPALLDQLRHDPSSVQELFVEPQVAAAAAALPEKLAAMKNTMLPRLQRLMQSGFGGMAPAQREALQKHLESLGLTPESTQTAEGAEKLLESIVQRTQAVFGRGAAGAGRSSQGNGVLGSLNIDKAWHGIHYLLCGKAEPDSDLGSQAVLGGDEIGDDEFGYGPARYFEPDKVAQIAALLDQPGIDASMRSRFDANAMVRLGIYPNGWSQNELPWLTGSFEQVRKFYRDAAGKGAAVLTCLV